MSAGTAALPVTLDIVERSPRWSAAPSLAPLIERAVAAAFAEGSLAAAPGAELSVVLADDAQIRELNRAWRGEDAPTNVLSFPAAEPHAAATAPLLGDVVLAYETITAEAAARGAPPGDHVAHLVIHGVLHLYGHDHASDDEAEAMEAIERRALLRLGIADPWREPRMAGA